MTIRELQAEPDLHRRHVTKSGAAIGVEVALTELSFRGRPAVLGVVTEVPIDPDRRFRLLVEHSADGISLLGADGIVTYMSPGAERILGLEPGELVGTPARANMHPEDEIGATGPRPGETKVVTNRARHRDGSYRWIESISTNLTHDPAVRAIVANFRDITTRHDAELLMRRSEENFRRLIERSPSATFVHRDGRFLYVNPAAVAMLGYQHQTDLIGHDVLELIHPGDHELARDRLSRTAIDSAPAEARMIRADGSVAILEGQTTLLEFDGKPTQVAVAHDITQRRELYAKMALADRLLSVGTLAAGVAHEINNPLAYVMANLALLGKELPKLLAGDRPPHVERAELESMLADAREGAARVSAIVRDLRALSRPEDDRRTAVDVASALSLSTRMANNEIRHRARLVEHCDPQLPQVAANASRLGQVFLNLLVNAAHAIEPGRADRNEIRIRARADVEHVIVEIEDTGAGIAPDVIDRIFDPFFTTKPAGVGTGLGLSISHQIIQSIGGSIAVTSTLGVGTTFRIALPIAAVAVEAPRAPARMRVEPTRTRLLLIDDEAAVGRSMRLLLAPAFDVVAVTSARAGLDKLAAGEPFDVIVCDLMMPEMTGADLYAELASSWPQYARRIVFISGGAFTDDARQFVDSLTTPYLEKPFTEQALRDAIAELRRP